MLRFHALQDFIHTLGFFGTFHRVSFPPSLSSHLNHPLSLFHHHLVDPFASHVAVSPPDFLFFDLFAFMTAFGTHRATATMPTFGKSKNLCESSPCRLWWCCWIKAARDKCAWPYWCAGGHMSLMRCGSHGRARRDCRWKPRARMPFSTCHCS